MADRPDIPVVPLREAAQILGVSIEAARSTLRHHSIRSGYPRAAVEWLADNRPGRGARTDLKERTMTPADLLAAIKLPTGIHAEYLTGTDPNHITFDRIVMWADRPYDHCPRCGQDITVQVDRPFHVDYGATGAPLQDYDQTHRCGLWLSVDGRELPGDTNETTIVAAARELDERRRQEIAQRREKIAEDLRWQLGEALRNLAEPLDDGETREERIAWLCTGNEATPGIYAEDGELRAWAYGPIADEDDTITVTPAGLATSQEEASR